MPETKAERFLPEFMGSFVPLEILNLEEHGGPTPLQIAAAKEYWLKMIDAGEGEELLFPIKGKTAQSAGMLVRLVACMAFQPGGVKVFGHHFTTSNTEILLSDKGIWQMPNYIYPPKIDVAVLRQKAARRRAALIAGGCATYEIGDRYEIVAIVCLCCGLGSTEPKDVNGRYCGFCNATHSEWETPNG